MFLVFFKHRQLPHILTGFLAGGYNTVYKRLVITHNARGYITQRGDTGAGQGSYVNNTLCLQPAGITQGIGQNQPAFGIRRYYFYGLAVHSLQYISGFQGAAAGQVLYRRHYADYVYPGLKTGYRCYGGYHRRSASHIVFHLFHILRRFQRDTTGVKSDSLAYQRQVNALGFFTLVFEYDKFRRLAAPLSYPQKRSHSQLLHILLFKNGKLQVILFSYL